MRVALSKILLSEPDLLLLDEPTNHLDLESLLWLESFLRAYRGALLLVSHDTEFLNRMVTEVLEIDQCKLWTYRGNLESCAIQKQERLTLLKSQYEGQQAKVAKARQAQSRLKQLEKMDLIEMPEDRKQVRFRFPPAPHSGREVVTMKGVSLRYGDHTVFKGLDWVIRRGSRVAIVGVNGAGKTTLLKLLSGSLEPSAGDLKLGHEVKVGYYAQHQADGLAMDQTIVKTLERVAPEMPISQVRAIAGAFLFSGDAVEKKCGVLSGGEKARVALAKLLLSPSNFLLLDEPTNHLDVESREVLLEALQAFEGTLCLVSHDRAFISPLVDTVLEIQPAPGGSRVIHRIGSYDDYLQTKMKELEDQSSKTSQSSKKKGLAPHAGMAKSQSAQVIARTAAGTPIGTPIGTEEAQNSSAKTPSNNQRRSWERERETLEREISQLERERANLLQMLADPATYQDKAKSLDLMAKQREIDSGLSSKLSRWEEVCERIGG